MVDLESYIIVVLISLVRSKHSSVMVITHCTGWCSFTVVDDINTKIIRMTMIYW